jgi:uncharacterized DUF497 family protein
MMHYHFEWDSVKAKANKLKHGVSFEEAAEIFLDPLQLSIPDNNHNGSEERWITLGHTQSQHLRLVVHTFVSYQHEQVNIRIISARPATRHEQKNYESEL